MFLQTYLVEREREELLSLDMMNKVELRDMTA